MCRVSTCVYLHMYDQNVDTSAPWSYICKYAYVDTLRLGGVQLCKVYVDTLEYQRCRVCRYSRVSTPYLHVYTSDTLEYLHQYLHIHIHICLHL